MVTSLSHYLCERASGAVLAKIRARTAPRGQDGCRTIGHHRALATNLHQVGPHLSNERVRLAAQRETPTIRRDPYHGAGRGCGQFPVAFVIDARYQPVRIEGAELSGDFFALDDFEIEA